MASMEKREADRLLVLNVMHEASRGDTSKLVGGSDIERLLNYKVSSRRIGAACAFLEARHLIETAGEVYIDHSPQYVRITNLGIAEIEKSLQSPRESTQYLPPALSVVHIEGNRQNFPFFAAFPNCGKGPNDLRFFCRIRLVSCPETARITHWGTQAGIR